ncbi:MAG: fibro-slime domain-containing protein, partial [Myxococcales bacterium]|nr:fibro-slime domain-containing protein [Myxococcales bacterium]
EVRYWFEYKGTEQLSFTGDDDVWVFVNKRRAINLGGVHGAQSASITLDAANAATFNLTIGQVYEIVVFQAERHTTQSNYLLTLSDFINGVTTCNPVCGDGIKTPNEACDDGVNDGSYGSCTFDCKKGPRCGDGIVQTPQEECDDGVNLSPYEGCAPGCQQGAFCGDGIVDSLFGEACDDGDNDGGYNECDPDCVLGDRCGDGVVQSAFEECDDGNSNNSDSCGNDCELNVAN